MCRTTSTYVGSYDPRKLKQLLADIAEAELELKQAKSLPTPNQDLIAHLREYLIDLESKFHS
jgi:hypothetical protein